MTSNEQGRGWPVAGGEHPTSVRGPQTDHANLHPPPAVRALSGAVLAIALLGGTAACSRGSAEEASASGPVTVTVSPANVTVAKIDRIETGPAISGSLRPENEAQLRAEVSGNVVQTYAEQGQAVRAGQSLARIDAAAAEEGLLSARSGLTSAQASADLARRELERAERLFAAGAIAERDLEGARRANIGAQAALADARARLASAQDLSGNTSVRAPFAGVVSERAISPGDVVAPGALLYRVVAPGSMQLEASVPAEQLGDIRVGQQVRFRVSGYGDRDFEGRITRVNPVADPTTRQVRIVASIPNAGSRLVGGLFAEGRVASETRDGIVLPLTAVNETGLAPSVLRVKGGRTERANVALGIRDAAAETVEIRSGLSVGDTVLVGAAAGISAGTPVRVGEVGDQARSATVGAPAPGGRAEKKQ